MQEQERYINSVNLNQDSDFPYLVLDVVNDQAYPRNPGFRVFHWHEDLQFIYVLEGTIELQTLEDSVRLSAGEGIFINKNVVHYVGRIGPCHYNSFLVPVHFLEFYPGSPARSMVEAVTASRSLTWYRFAPETDWCRQVLDILRGLCELEKRKDKWYSYEVLSRFSALWLLLMKHIDLPQEQRETALNLRMQRILRFIQQHYMDDLTLEDLAASANVSKSECARCFKLSLNTTPYKYLTEFRLSKAAELLKQSDEPISNIAMNVGFRQISHFGKCFKAETGLSPKAYREKWRGK